MRTLSEAIADRGIVDSPAWHAKQAKARQTMRKSKVSMPNAIRGWYKSNGKQDQCDIAAQWIALGAERREEITRAYIAQFDQSNRLIPVDYALSFADEPEAVELAKAA